VSETRIEYVDSLNEEIVVKQAVDLLRVGEVVALPTETVYGLGANALDESAVAKIFEVKERPSFDPLIVHVARIEDLSTVAEIPEEIETELNQMLQEFWPGALTVVLPKKACVPDIVTSGMPNVAVRLSAHPVMRAVVQALGSPVAAPSANKFGSISPTSANAVEKELGGRIPLIVDGGACNDGLESTIVRPEMGDKGRMHLHLLRPGPVVKEQLQKHGKVIRPKKASKDAPGQLESHYAPRVPLYMFDDPADFQPDPEKSYGLLSYRGAEKDGYVNLHDWAEVAELSPGKGKLAEASVRLFYVLRELDESGVDAIIAEPVSAVGLGVAIMDRLKRASSPRIELI